MAVGFGCAANLDRNNVRRDAAEVTRWDGIVQYKYCENDKVVYEREVTKDECHLSGSGADTADNSLQVPLISVSYSAEEEILGPEIHSVGTLTGSQAPVATNDQLCRANLIKWVAKNESITIRGQGDLPAAFPLTKQRREIQGTAITINPFTGGTNLGINITSADGTTAQMWLESVSYVEEKRAFKEWEITVTKRTPSTTADLGTSVLLADMELFGNDGDEIDPGLSSVYKLSRKIDFSNEGWAKLSETAEIWSDVDNVNGGFLS